jgi:eukaryotic-like serine/threonine-protein kinase
VDLKLPHHLARFGVFELDLRARELRKGGLSTGLPEQSIKILALLVEKPGEVVLREEIRKKLWPDDTIVEFDHSINAAIKRLRQSLGDPADAPRYIDTLARRGYRWKLPVEWVEAQPQTAVRVEVENVPSSTAAGENLIGQKVTHYRALILLPAVVLLVLAALGWRQFSRVQAARRLTDKDTIVLADFNNTTGDPVFDGTLKQALSIGLAQSPFLHVLSDQKVGRTLRMMGHQPGSPLDEKTAREVCQRTGSSAVLSGMIANLGSQYVLGLNTVTCATGEPMAQELVQAARKEDVLKAMDKAVTKLRGELGESLSSIEKLDVPIWQATTPSFEALKAFSMAQKAFYEKGDADAIPLFQRAVELDPNFAAAYSGLGVSYTNLHELSLANANYRKAFDLRDRVTDRERFGIEAFYYDGVTGELEKANQAYARWAQAYPRDYAPHTNLSTNYQALGQYDKALVEARACLQINPDDASCHINAMSYYTALDRLPEAEDMARQAIARKLDFAYLHTALYALAFLKGDPVEMQHQVNWGAGKAGAEDLLLTEQSDTEAFYGRFTQARELSRRAIELDRNSDQKEAAALWQMNVALREAEVGNFAVARRETAAALKLAPTDDTRMLAALALAGAGDLAQAQTIASDIAKRFPLNTVVNRYWLPTINASIETRRNQPTKAVEALQEAEPYELGAPAPQFGDGAPLYPAYARGQAYLALHQGKEAAAEFQKFLDHRGATVNGVLGALAHLGLARAYQVSGDTDRAHAAYQDFFTLWKNADSDIPILKQAKAEYAKLK